MSVPTKNDVLLIIEAPTSRAALVRCRSCRAWVGQAIDDSRLATNFDLEPLPSPEAEEEAWALGRSTYTLWPDGTLSARYWAWSTPTRRLVLARHVCKEPNNHD
jgi:hypothetical protein